MHSKYSRQGCHCHLKATLTGDEYSCSHCNWSVHRQGNRWLSPQQVEPAGFNSKAVKRLQTLDNHFWMRERRFLLEKLLQRYNLQGGRAVELGCGTGSFIPVLERHFDHITAIDAHAELLAMAEQQSPTAEFIQSDVCQLPLADHSYSLVLALDVIEHVAPDAFLSEARRITIHGGHLLLSAPSSAKLWSDMDIQAGHRCRYSRNLMEQELRQNGWEPVGYTHYQFLLYPLVWLSTQLGTRSDSRVERSPPAWLDRLLGTINRIETMLSAMVPLPYGSSLFVIAKAV